MSLPPGITFTNATGQTFTTGKRGKPPGWVSLDPKYIELTKNQVSSSKASPIIPESGLKCWKWSDQTDDGVKVKTALCLVAASTPMEAIELLARRFPKNPVSGHEFRLMWKQIDIDKSIQTPGVYELNAEKLLTLKTT